MAKDDKKNESVVAEKRYLYMKCPTCRVKLHVEAFKCWKCGNRANYNAEAKESVNELIFGSKDSNYAIYNQKLNDLENCFSCRNTQAGKACEHCYNFGFGKGRCDLCNEFQSIRFMCCQKAQKLNPNPRRELNKMLAWMLERKENSKVLEAVSEEIKSRVGVAV